MNLKKVIHVMVQIFKEVKESIGRRKLYLDKVNLC